MLAAVKRFLRLRLGASLDRATLRRIPRRSCDAKRLAALSAEEVVSRVDSPAIHDAWGQVAECLEEACAIEDRKTGGVSPDDRRLLWYLVRAFKPASVLEIGTHVGASTLYLAGALRDEEEVRENRSKRLVTVDIADVNDPQHGAWKAYGLSRSPRERLECFGVGEMVEFVTGNSLDLLRSGADRFDLIFLDGDHAAPTVYQEVCGALERLSQGGLILLHDYYPKEKAKTSAGMLMPGPRLAFERLQREGAQLQLFPLQDLPWRKIHFAAATSLTLVVRRA